MRYPETNRYKKYADSDEGEGGHFMLLYNKVHIFCIASDGEGWEHCSVSIPGENRTPTWAEMCFVKSKFWDDEDTVIQFHPPKSQYVNNHNYCLHLWRKSGVNFETPPTVLVGIKF